MSKQFMDLLFFFYFRQVLGLLLLRPDESLYVLQTISAAYKAAETGHTQPVATT